MNAYTLQNNGGQVLIKPLGKLTATEVPALQGDLKTELDQGANQAVFDFAETEMLDSSGIGLLIAVYNTLNRRQGKLQVTNVSAEIMQLLQSMRLAGRLQATTRSA